MSKKIVIVGGGPGGYTAAIRAAQLGAEVTLIEKDQLGGTCLNRGCIPTKALLASTAALETIANSEEYGIRIEGEYLVDWAGWVERKNKIVSQLTGGIAQLLKQHGVTTIYGKARLAAPFKIEVETENGTETVSSEATVIATGSESAKPPIFDFDQPAVITSTEGLNLEKVPESLLIVGGGVIGCEFATIFANLGCEVTIVEMLPQILPTEDKRVAAQLGAVLRKKGVVIKTGVRVERVNKYDPEGAEVELGDGTIIKAEKVMVAVGRSLNSGAMGLEELGIDIERGCIKVDKRMETNLPNVFAVGDVSGGILLAHVAAHEGMVAVANAMGGDEAVDYRTVPSCIFTHPEVASVGLTADKAGERGINVKTGRFPFAASGKAVAMGEAQGFVQLVVEADSERVIGAQMIGPGVTDLIHEIALAIKVGATAGQISDTVHAHPTLAEAVMEASEAVHNKAIHFFSR